jgi:enamine deaminase RidA (YjgF/YER057c/UK114 family)
MASIIDGRLRALDIELPAASSPGANYIQFTRLGSLLCITGQLPKWQGERRFVGRLGADFGVDEGKDAARLCALNVIAVVRDALDGDLDRVVRCLRLRGYVNATPEFTAHSQVIDGASDAIVALFGDAGRHTRVAIGAGIPYGCAVEVEAEFDVR